MKYPARLLPVLLCVTILHAQIGSPPPSHPSILPKAEFHTGETARFTFAGTVNVQPRVNSRLANTAVAGIHPRQYRLEGAMVATFLGMPSGQMLSGTLRFENLRVRDWVSESDVRDVEIRLQQMESNSWIINRELALAGTSVVPRNDPYSSDLDAIVVLAQLILAPWMGEEPLAPGDRKVISRTSLPGAIKPDVPTPVAVEYVADVPINHRACAEFRLFTALPLQQLPSPPEWAEKLGKVGVQPLSRASSETAATYLYDAEAHAFIVLRLQSRVNVSIEAESGDANATVRIPVVLVTRGMETAFNAERVLEPPSPARDAELAAFEKHIDLSPISTTGSDPTRNNVNPSGEVSLGDLARKTRAQNEGHGKQTGEITLENPSSAGADPPGFKTFKVPDGSMTVLLPVDIQPAPIGKQSVLQRYVARVGTPPVILVIVLGQGPPPSGNAKESDLLENVLRDFIGPNARLAGTQDMKLGERAAKVAEYIQEKTTDTPSLRGLAAVSVTSDRKSLGALICASSESDYPTAEPVCHTIVESMRLP